LGFEFPWGCKPNSISEIPRRVDPRILAPESLKFGGDACSA
jgi:hypothetical protein